MRTKVLIIMVLLFTMTRAIFASEVAQDVKIDIAKDEVSYVLTKPAFVRIILGLEDGPMFFTTLADWAPRQKGAHKEKWNRTGISEIDKLLYNQKTIFALNYFTTDPDDKPTLNIRDIEGEQGIISPIGRSSGNINLNYFHKNHKREF